MTKAERNAWEKEKGFKSFGTICDEFYETIEFEKCKNIDEIKCKDTKGYYLNIYLSKGVYYVEPVDININERLLANNKKMFMISNRVYKIIESKLVSTSIDSISELQNIDNIDEYKSSKLYRYLHLNRISNISNSVTYEDNTKETENGSYKSKVYIETENFWASFPTRTEIETEFTITNYKKGLFGYYAYTLPTKYDIEISAYDEVSDKWCNVSGKADDHSIKSYNRSSKTFISDGWSNRFNPRFYMVKVYVLTTAGEITINK